jgi:hypothetical protein
MANNENKASKDNRVELFVPKGYANDDPNFYVSVNGVNYILPRGKKSMVPDFVADEYHRSVRAQEKLDETIEQMQEASK